MVIVMFMVMFMVMIMAINMTMVNGQVVLWIQVDLLNPVDASESSNSRPKGFSVARGQGDPWSVM
jgi:nitrogen fixation protein FixH